MDGPSLFRKHENKLMLMEGFKRGIDYVEVKCGCTSFKFGDAIGTLRVYANGQFVIRCQCMEGCNREKLTPYEFEKHSRKEGTSKWPSHIWVIINNKKVALWRTVLLKYYKHATNGGSGSKRRNFHRDEFIRCWRCRKERRFRLTTKEACRIYHEASNKMRWQCADWPYGKITCDDDEERASRRNSRGCPRSATCQGCTACVCLGCLKCRFVDCTCRTCVDYMQNAAP